MTRVSIVADQLRRPVPGGIGTYIHGLAKGLRELNAGEISFLASRPVGPDPLNQYGFPVRSSLVPSRVLARLWAVGRGLSPIEADVVHATSFALPPTKKPLVVTVHDIAWRDFPEAYPKRGKEWHEAAFRRTLKRASGILTPSPSVVDRLQADGFDAARIAVIEEGVDHLKSPDFEGADRLLESKKVSGPFLLAVGTLEPRKNLKRLFSAYSAALSEMAEAWPLVVIGPVGWGERVEPVRGVVLAGKVEERILSALYARCQLFITAPLVEGYGLPAVEAMAMGAVVVSSPVPSTKGAALEVDPTDEASIAAAIVRASSDEVLRHHLRGLSAARAAQLTWRSVADQHRNFWEQVNGW